MDYVETKVTKWGNAKGVRLAKKISEHIPVGTKLRIQKDARGALLLHPVSEERGTFSFEEAQKHIIPTKKKVENISENIDKILYGKE